MSSTDKYTVALVSDFFCPNAGGVETHIYFLAQCLLKLGHRVIVITHAYGDRKGIRYLSGGLKVYYLPFIVVYNGCSLATIIGSLPWFRKIFIRENVQLIHGHSTFSSMCHEALFNGWLMGIRTVFTDHSLFGFADASAILTNTLVLQYSLATVNRVICVSYTSKENTVLRGKLDPSKVLTIPNAIETSLFYPDQQKFYSNPTTIVFIGRLVYRKGAELLCDIIPKVCGMHPKCRFLIGGDGPKRVEMEEMREKYNLHDRVIMLGMVPHDMVRDVLVQGQIFVNTSLTEAFCMAIVEAASCGLHVISTRVGGIPEVLPDHLVSLEAPDPDSLVSAICDAIRKRENGELVDPQDRHDQVRKMYYWPEIAARTEIVYKEAMSDPPRRILDGYSRYYANGLGFGILYIVVASINLAILAVLQFFDPAQDNVPERTTTKSRLLNCVRSRNNAKVVKKRNLSRSRQRGMTSP